MLLHNTKIHLDGASFSITERCGIQKEFLVSSRNRKTLELWSPGLHPRQKRSCGRPRWWSEWFVKCQIPLRYPSRELVRELVCHQLSNCMGNGIWPNSIKLSSIPARELHPARELVAYLVSDLSQTGSSYVDMSR